jgi:hypothetical protein
VLICTALTCLPADKKHSAGGAAVQPEQGALQSLLKKPIALLDTIARRRSSHSSNAGMRGSDSNAAGAAGQCVEEVAGALDTQLAAAHFQNGMVPSGSLPATPGSTNSLNSWGVSKFICKVCRIDQKAACWECKVQTQFGVAAGTTSTPVL